jgi:hypothetical protein
MAPSAPPRFQAPIESLEQAREREQEVELVARAVRRPHRPAETDDNPPDVPVGVRPTMENP